MGGSKFGARAYADNFSDEELLEALDYAHLYGRRVYLTVNTLLKTVRSNRSVRICSRFMNMAWMRYLYRILGSLTAIHEISGSCDSYKYADDSHRCGGGRLFRIRVTRMVMARELSLNEMKRIREETGMELEAFVHGALCYCYSGQCLFSSMLGGRKRKPWQMCAAMQASLRSAG